MYFDSRAVDFLEDSGERIDQGPVILSQPPPYILYGHASHYTFDTYRPIALLVVQVDFVYYDPMNSASAP